ncbi:MAG: hypothetical protein GC137_06405 [Alphaproteobacteria bacterium]|nr:hypothetical protein [Alphaproteobacteria bacterium]
MTYQKTSIGFHRPENIGDGLSAQKDGVLSRTFNYFRDTSDFWGRTIVVPSIIAGGLFMGAREIADAIRESNAVKITAPAEEPEIKQEKPNTFVSEFSVEPK